MVGLVLGLDFYFGFFGVFFFAFWIKDVCNS